MPRFYTHLENHNGLQCDEEGAEFANGEQALRRAGNTAGSVLTEDLVANRSPVRIVLTIEDEGGTVQGSIEVSAEVKRRDASDQHGETA